MGRVYKFLLFRYEYEPVSDKYEKDYFNFNSMYLQRLDAKKQEDLKSIVHQIHQHRDSIMQSQQKPDFLEAQGFKYSEQTFDDLYVKGFKETFANGNISTESSEDIEEETKQTTLNGK